MRLSQYTEKFETTEYYLWHYDKQNLHFINDLTVGETFHLLIKLKTVYSFNFRSKWTKRRTSCRNVMFAQVIFDNKFVTLNTTLYCLQQEIVRCFEEEKNTKEMAWLSHMMCKYVCALCVLAYNCTAWKYSSYLIEMCHPISQNNWKRLCIRSYFTQCNNFITSHSRSQHSFFVHSAGVAEVKHVLCQLCSIINWISVCVICKKLS